VRRPWFRVLRLLWSRGFSLVRMVQLVLSLVLVICRDYGTEKGAPSIGESGMRKWFTKFEHRMVLRNFSPPNVIMCHHSIEPWLM
jgi:hypothetical protein